ncbi:uncharacterized protein LOC130138711 [Syzygium oleosum]|uniref:uncharacterized protein LOC130138711 n=1 Tax=Syzygium oleosum TaxID=219896 RepID=UPI0024BA5EBA|nr:uncharacterized protein LOC130138711 [Syzygium oleosum]
MGGLDTGRRGQHQGDDEGLDLLLLGVGDRGRGGGRGGLGVGGGGGVVGGRRGGPAGAEVVLEVDGGGLADLLVDGGLDDEAEDGEGVAGAVGGVGEGGLGLAARGGGRGRGCGGSTGRGTGASPDSTPWGSCSSSEEELRWPGGFGGPVVA